MHAHIIGHLKSELPSLFGKSSKQTALMSNLPAEFEKIQHVSNLPAGDFPDIDKFKETLSKFDMREFKKLDSKLLSGMQDVLATDLPRLMQEFPMSQKVIAAEER